MDSQFDLNPVWWSWPDFQIDIIGDSVYLLYANLCDLRCAELAQLWVNPIMSIKDTAERFIDRWVTVRRILSDAKRSLPLDTLILTPQEVAHRLAVGDQFVAEILERGEVLYAA